MRTNDVIREDVREELEWSAGLDESAIRVVVEEGVVTLTGHVASWIEKRRAEDAAKRVAGVRGVANDVEVRVPGSQRRDDTDLVEAALAALRWDYSVPHTRLKVTVDHGSLSLDGDVDWQYQRRAAERAVQGLLGVRHVTNRITVKPRVTLANVQQRIEAAFKRSAEIDAKNVGVEIDEGRVTLSGRVHSWAEWEEAEEAAWAAPGVTEVNNFLEVRDETPVAF